MLHPTLRVYVFSLQPTFLFFSHAQQQTANVWIFALVHCSSYTVTWSTQSSDTVRVLLHSVFGSRPRVNVRSSLRRLLICSGSFLLNLGVTAQLWHVPNCPQCLPVNWWTSWAAYNLGFLHFALRHRHLCAISGIMCFIWFHPSFFLSLRGVLLSWSSLVCGALHAKRSQTDLLKCSVSDRSAHHSCCDQVTLFWAVDTWRKQDISVIT